jgi:NADP-dependent 3-hydroxy acid dehydrogenase YdfG
MKALVTGATSGIGKATAIMLARNGYDLIITGRRLPKLVELEKFLKKEYQIEVIKLNFDIRKKLEVEEQLNLLSESWRNIDVLINNAGLAAGLDFLYEGDIKDWETMIDTNVKGLLYVSRFFMPIMISRRQGHIVNISSIAGKEVYAKGNVYCATKHAVEALTKAMRIELLPYGIKVSSIAPGMVETEFSIVRLGDEQKAKEVYKGFDPLLAEDIADAVEFVLTRPKHVNINDILIMPSAQANSTTVHKENVE